MDNFEFLVRDPYLNKSWINMIKLTLANILKMVVPLVNAVLIYRLANAKWQYRYRVTLYPAGNHT